MPLRLRFSGQLDLADPSAGGSVVTRIDVEVVFEGAPVDERPPLVARGQVALLQANLVGPDLWEALDGEDDELKGLARAYFDDDGQLREPYDASGSDDLLHLVRLQVEDAWRGRRMEQGIVRRLADTFGAGCALVTLTPSSPVDRARWEEMGFAPSAAGAPFMQLELDGDVPQVLLDESAATFVLLREEDDDDLDGDDDLDR